VEQDLKESFQQIAENNGYTMSDVITASMRDVVKRGMIPLYLTSKLPRKNRSIISIPEIKRLLEIMVVMNGYENKINSISLFGSYAKGKASPNSDVDLLVDCNDMSLFTIAALKEDLEKALQKDVDLVTTGNLDPYFEKVVNKEKIVLYERQNLRIRSQNQ
jgi:hypothetical protein